MTSPRQIRANRENAKKSSGPRSDLGKARASLNAISHGLTAKHVVLPGENPEEFQILLDGLIDEYNPETVLARQLILQLAGLLWRLRRIPTLERAVMTVRLDEIDGSELARLEEDDQLITDELGRSVALKSK